MGISVEQWRSSIGFFYQKVNFRGNNYRSTTGCIPFLLCIIAALLLIGGIELNPGPTVVEVSKRLDDFISSYQTSRDHLLLSVPSLPAFTTLTARLDDFIKETTTIVNSMNAIIMKQENRLCALEASITKGPYEEISTNIPLTQNSIHDSQIGVDASSIEQLVRNALEKDKRKCNVIIYNIYDYDSFQEDKFILSELMYDLDLDENLIESISRVGYFSNYKPRPLRVQLAHDSYVSIFLEAAYQLKTMKRKWPKVGISPDRSPAELRSHQTLMSDYKRRCALGEKIRIDGDKIVPLKNKSTGPSLIQTMQNKTPPDVSLCSSLRVMLPPITPSAASSSLSAAASSFYPSLLTIPKASTSMTASSFFSTSMTMPSNNIQSLSGHTVASAFMPVSSISSADVSKNKSGYNNICDIQLVELPTLSQLTQK